MHYCFFSRLLCFCSFLHLIIIILVFWYFFRDSFPHDHQFACIMKFVVEQTHSPNIKVFFSYFLFLFNYLVLILFSYPFSLFISLYEWPIFSQTVADNVLVNWTVVYFYLQVKLAILNYVNNLSAVMSPSLICNTSDARLAFSRFITWASEPKSPDVRKVKFIVIYSSKTAVVKFSLKFKLPSRESCSALQSLL